ncbi:hypothetical protein M9H77_13393 [Catharanthus roseus]|uniref:Uncharacterized protein n=1 Tax=Catharanthus roseus TaxID=4058 RepID=A0ACC0BKD6_CATRO|nr:hypothetical protein M9H77_13393 [Catharanthus roseus]
MVSSPLAEPQSELFPSQADGEPVMKSPHSMADTTAGQNDNSNTNNTEEQEPTASPQTKPVGQSSTVVKWPGWPGFNVFRLIVPVLKVGSIIGRKGELVKKLCEETGARIRVLEGALGTSDRIVLISGKEDPDLQLSPAMDAVLRVFKHVCGLSPIEGGTVLATAMTSYCSMRLLVASSQAIHLIGKHGSTIKSIKEKSGASLQVLSDEMPPYATSDERIIEIQGEASKVLSAGEAVLKQLRKFLVDQSVLPVFEKTCNNTNSQDRMTESYKSQSLNMPPPALAHGPQVGFHSDFSLPMKRDNLLFKPEVPVDSKLSHSAISRFGQDSGPADVRSTALGRIHTPIVTQITKVMQVPLSYAEDIIGIGGGNIGYIRRTSGAVLTVQESGALPDEITIEIKGTSSQVQAAEQLIQDSINNHKEPAPSIYGNGDPYSHLTDLYSTSSYQSQSQSRSLGVHRSFRF